MWSSLILAAPLLGIIVAVFLYPPRYTVFALNAIPVIITCILSALYKFPEYYAILYSLSVLGVLVSFSKGISTTISFMALTFTSTKLYWETSLPFYVGIIVGIYYIIANFIYASSIMAHTPIIITRAHRYTRLVAASIALAFSVIIFWFLPFLIITISRSDIAHTSSETLECLPIGHIYQKHLGGITCMQKIEELVPNTNNFFSLNDSQLNWVTYTYIAYWFMNGSIVVFYVLFLIASKYSEFHFTNNVAILSWVMLFISVALFNYTTRSIYASVGTSTTKTYVGPSFYVQVLTFATVLFIDLGFLITSKLKHKQK